MPLRTLRFFSHPKRASFLLATAMLLVLAMAVSAEPPPFSSPLAEKPAITYNSDDREAWILSIMQETDSRLLSDGGGPIPIPDSLYDAAFDDPDVALALGKKLLDRWKKGMIAHSQNKSAKAGPVLIENTYLAYGVLEQAKFWLHMALAKDRGEAAYLFARLAGEAGRQKPMVTWLRVAARLQEPQASLVLGNAYLFGKLGIAPDCKAAAYYFAQAEKHGEFWAFHNHAWLLATAKDKACRNPEKALRLWWELDWEKVPQDALTQALFADTVAAIYAALSDFGSAMEAQKAALQLLKDARDKDLSRRQAMQRRLQRYQSRQPWFESDFRSTGQPPSWDQ